MVDSGLTEARASAAAPACHPAPKSPTTRESSRDKYLAPTAIVPATRILCCWPSVRIASNSRVSAVQEDKTHIPTPWSGRDLYPTNSARNGGVCNQVGVDPLSHDS